MDKLYIYAHELPVPQGHSVHLYRQKFPLDFACNEIPHYRRNVWDLVSDERRAHRESDTLTGKENH